MRKPKVSVIVPVYNGEGFIKDTLQIILKSSLQEIEVIVVDDGSIDNSFQICSEMMRTDSRIKVFRQENTGVFGARNHGLKEATGKYVCFCDQDDEVVTKAYDIMYLAAEENNCEVVMASTGKIIGEKRETFEQLPDMKIEGEKIGEYCMLPILFNGTNCYSNKNEIRLENDIWKCMIKKEFIEKNGLEFRHIVNYEDDFLLLLDVLARAQKVVMISDILYYWRINLKSETYNTKYVRNLYEKDIKLQDEIISIMRIARINESYVELYRKCQNCNRYVHVVENENRNKEVKFEAKIDNIKQLKKELDFVESLEIRKQYKKNLIHRKIVLGLLADGFFVWAYLFHKVYVTVRERCLHFSVWTSIENYLYHKG